MKDYVMFNLANVLAQWCARCDIYPEQARRRAEIAISDTVACMWAGVSDPAVTAAAFMRPDLAQGKATSLRHRAGMAAPWAAMINGCAAHAVDFDDNFFPAITHASAALVPALFALGEEVDASGADVVLAYIAGLEVEAQIGKLVNPLHYESGWHATSTIGTIGVAAACARLLNLDADRILHAMSIGFSLAGGSKKQFGTMVKPLHVGFAAMHGIMAARLAASGMQGERQFLQGRWSFEELYAGNANDGSIEPALYPEAPLAIDEYGLVAKLYPSCMSSHLGIDALLAMRGWFDVAQIEQIDIHMPAFMIANLCFSDPKSEMEARFSMNYCAAITLLHGVPRLAHFTLDAIRRDDIKPLLPLVRMHVREAQSGTHALPWGGDCEAQVTLKSGAVFKERVLYPKGCNQNPLTAAEHREKFMDCASPALGKEAAAALHMQLHHIYRLERIAEVMQNIRPAEELQR